MLESRYDPKEAEARIYKQWEESGLFNPDICIEKGVATKDAESFSMALPPPNVTGTLHIGHAFEDTLQDVLVRFHRMRGKKTLWVPGTDHAAIATQSKVEKILQKEEGKSRHDLGREEFLKRVEKFAQESHDTIVNQVKRMGASLDWSREAYTLDDTRNLAVRTAFKKMYDEGLIYRDYRIVNWDPKGQTVISDDEVVYEERKGTLYTFKYAPDFPIAISSTRPETKVGDTAVAVHPDDERYTRYVGKEYDIVFCGVPIHIKIIADPAVEKEFGTGALGVTPAHSFIDWEIKERHGLPIAQVINEYGRMTVGDDPTYLLKGKKIAEAREMVVQWLRDNNLLEKEEETVQNIATAERSGGIIEPLPKLQWFVGVDRPFTIKNSKINGIAAGRQVTLKQLMKAAVENGQVTILPERFEKIYSHWIDNLRDWCISRQLWFGHRIPVWYKGEETYVDMEPPQGEGWEQDSDTLDTWFSSGLWTFSTLGWPQHADTTKADELGPENDLANYHPTSVIAPGYEILFFWIARMVLMSTYLLGEIPFHTACIHGMVRDKSGRKFSKSLGNGIEPIDMIEKYGADALRMGLLAGASPGSDVKFDEQRIKGYRNFSTKIWNAARFVLMSKPDQMPEHVSPSSEDQAALGEVFIAKAEVAKHIESFEFHLAAERAYHYFWHTFADKVIEAAKPRLKGEDEAAKAAAYQTLEKILIESLTFLHPFMPFITEEVYQKIRPGETLMVRRWE